MSDRYVTRQGDVVDLICWRYYGQTTGTTELVLDANPGLADRGPVLPAGIEILLPDAPRPETVPVIRIWS
jgi:phage tail protein X